MPSWGFILPGSGGGDVKKKTGRGEEPGISQKDLFLLEVVAQNKLFTNDARLAGTIHPQQVKTLPKLAPLLLFLTGREIILCHPATLRRPYYKSVYFK